VGDRTIDKGVFMVLLGCCLQEPQADVPKCHAGSVSNVDVFSVGCTEGPLSSAGAPRAGRYPAAERLAKAWSLSMRTKLLIGSPWLAVRDGALLVQCLSLLTQKCCVWRA
jgi:hypothetical protein